MTRYLIIALAIVVAVLSAGGCTAATRLVRQHLWTKKASPRYGPGLPD